MTYAKDRHWSDQYIPHIKHIVGPRLLDNAPIEEDVKHATDLMIFTARDLRIAARVRRSGYLERYPYDVTIRYSRDSGVTTEHEKIQGGFGDWMLYGHAEPPPSRRLAAWWLLDLDVFRAATESRRVQPNNITANRDGTTFAAYDVRRFPAGFVIASAGIPAPT